MHMFVISSYNTCLVLLSEVHRAHQLKVNQTEWVLYHWFYIHTLLHPWPYFIKHDQGVSHNPENPDTPAASHQISSVYHLERFQFS